MKYLITHLLTMAVATAVLTTIASEESDQSEFPTIIQQPTDDAIPVGFSTVFSVSATNGNLAYRWMRNGVYLEGETNSSLAINSVTTNDVGYYSVDVIRGNEVIPTRSASLNVYTTSLLGGGPITVYGTPLLGGGSSGSCPGTYIGYVVYTKPLSQGWGWAPIVGATNLSATDGTGRTDTKVQYIGRFGDVGCNQTTVTIPAPPYSNKYRFGIYFASNMPTNSSYPIVLEGFNP